MEYSACREHGTKKKSESPTGIKPVTFRTPVGRSNHRVTGRLGEHTYVGHIYWVRGDVPCILLGSAMSKCPIGDK